jgi:hypothetical protein
VDPFEQDIRRDDSSETKNVVSGRDGVAGVRICANCVLKKDDRREGECSDSWQPYCSLAF